MCPEGKQLCEWIGQAGGLPEFIRLLKAIRSDEQKLVQDYAVAALSDERMVQEARVQMGRVNFVDELISIAEHSNKTGAKK